MRGLELSRQWCDTQLLPRLKRALSPSVLQLLAIGMAGRGSECFGFDDDISTDHDYHFGCSIWIPYGVFDNSGLLLLKRLYSDAKRNAPTAPADTQRSAYGGRFEGVVTIDDFLVEHIGFPRVPDDERIWLKLPEYGLAEATNGQIFYDPSGLLTTIRKSLFTAMPADVFLKRLSYHAILAAQSGQYNAARCLAHGERGAAHLAMAEFVQHIAAIIYLLNGRYAPYYKWLLRGMKDLPRFSDLAIPLEAILCSQFDDQTTLGLIDDIAAQVIRELRARNLSDSDSDYLEPHAFSMQSQIMDSELRQLHIMELG